jgi:hypothetical protein
MRRAAEAMLERGGPERIESRDVERALANAPDPCAQDMGVEWLTT